MNCKYFRKRSKKKTVYFYCVKYKKEVPIFCKQCGKVEYKLYNTMKLHTNKQNKIERKRFSIIYSDLTKCCNCGSRIDIEKNEVFEGAYRQISIKYGMVCPFCKKCHHQFHNNIMFNLFYKVMFEKEFLKTHNKDEFIRIFGQDYIYKLEKNKRNVFPK